MQLKLQTKEKKILQIPVFRNQLKALSMVEKDDETLTFVICEESVSYGFSSENRDIIDCFYFPEEELTTVEAAILEDQHILLVYGTEEGRVMFREDWVLTGKQFSLDSEVRQIRFSYDLNFLVVLTANGSLY